MEGEFRLALHTFQIIRESDISRTRKVSRKLRPYQLPEGWGDRTHQVKNDNTLGNTGYCLEVHDLAASKLAAFREKDRDFVRVLLIEQIIDADIFLHRIDLLPVSDEIKERSVNWIKRTVKDL